MSPPRLLGITNLYPPAAGGGYGEICADFMGELANRGNEVTMLVGRGSAGGGVRVRPELGYMPGPWRHPRAGLAAAARTRRAVERALGDGVDAAIVWHMRGVAKSSLRLVHRAGVPVFYMVHDRWILYDRPGSLAIPWARLDRLGAGAARPPIAREGIVCFVSRWLRDEHSRRGWRAQREHIVPCGVDRGRFTQGPRAPAGPPRRLLFAGRVDPSKGPQVAVRALQGLSYEPTLTVAGGGTPEQLTALSRLAESLGLAGRVNVLGEVPRARMPELLREHDALVYPSIGPEAYSLGLLEGLAAGALVVTSAVGGPREYLEDGSNALLFEPGDVAACRDRLEQLGQAEVAARLREGARTTAERLSLDAVVTEFEALVHRAVRA